MNIRNNNKVLDNREEIDVSALEERKHTETDFVAQSQNIFSNNENSNANLLNNKDEFPTQTTITIQKAQVGGVAEMLMAPEQPSSNDTFNNQTNETKRNLNNDDQDLKIKKYVTPSDANTSQRSDQKRRSFISSNEKQKVGNKKGFSERIIKTLLRNNDAGKEDRHPQQCEDIMQRNKQIEDLEPYQYQYMFHINNLRKMRGEPEVSDCQTFNIGANLKNEEFIDGEKLINAQMVPHVCNDQLYLIVYSYQAYYQKTDSGKELEFEGRTLLRIFKIDLVSDQKPTEIHKQYLMTNIVKWKNIKNAFPGVWNQGKLYYTFIDNDFAEKTSQFKVLEYDFETESETTIVEKSESMPEVDGNILEPILGMLSVYFHIGDDLKFDYDKSNNLSKEEFLELTYAQFHYRSSEKNKEGDFISEQHTFRLCNFKKQLNTNTQTSYQAILDDKTVEVPIKQFIQFGKYFSCKFKYDPVDDRDELYAYFQDIQIEKGEANLSKPQDASLIEEETHNRMVHYFQHYYSLHSLNRFEELKLGESNYLSNHDKSSLQIGLVDHKIHKHDQINDFMKLADDWNFSMCDHEHSESLDDIDSMNIIFDNINDQIIVAVASGIKLQIKIVKTQSDFTKVQPIKEYVCNKEEGIAKAENKIENDDLIIEVKASQTDGIFIQISTKEEEVLLQEIVEFNFDKETFKMSSLCWSGDCIKVPGSKTERMQNFMCGRVNHNKQFQQVQEFRLIYDPSYWKTPGGETTRIIDKKSISSSQFLKFLKNSSKMIEIQLFSLNVIVLRDPLPDENNQLQPIGERHTSQTDPIITRTIDQKATLTGGEWWSDESDNRIVVRMSEILGKNHNLKSDIAESQYKLYIDENKQQRAIHFQTTLTQQFRDQKKSPWLRSDHLIESIKNTQQPFREMIEKRNIMGVSATKYLQILERLTDQNCLTQHDRQRILKQQMRTLINMIQVDFKHLILDEENIDIFNPIEQLNGQCLCDFYLKTTEHIAKRLEYQTLKAGTLKSSLIEEFIESQHMHTHKMGLDHLLKSSLYQDMKEEGFLQAQNELIGGLFGANPLVRCFMGKEQITTAQLLLNQIFKGSISQEERSILMNVMRYILECKIEPFPFAIFSKFFELQNNDTPCYFYVLKDKKLENYSDKNQMLSMAEQRNYSANATKELKYHIASTDLVVVQKMINQERKTIPIQHAIIDYHQMHLPYKTAQIRAGKDIKYTKIPTISEHLLKVSQKYAKDIQKHPVLKKMNDCLFEQTSKYFNTLLFIQMFGFFLPLVFQILLEGDPDLVLKCNYSCLTVTIFLQIQEILLMMNQSAYEYWFGDLYHIIDNVLFVVYYYYFSLRYSNPEAILLPLARKECDLTEDMDPLCIGATDIKLQVQFSILNFILIFGGMSMTLEIIRVQKAVGQQVKLVQAVLQDVVAFFIFFISWVVVFSLLHRVIGNGMGIEVIKDGPDIFWQYILGTWNMSTGGSKNPDFKTWFKFKNAEENRKLSFFMVFVIWGINIANAIFVRIILISFLIGIIKKTYDTQMNGEVQNSYEARAEMNQKSSLMLKQLRLLHESDLVVLSANYYSQVKSAPGIETVKEDIQNLGSKIEIIKDGINTIKTQNDDEISSIKKDIKNMNKKMDSELSEIKILLKQILNK